MLNNQLVLARHSFDEAFPESLTRNHVRLALQKFFHDDVLIIERLALMSESEIMEIPGIGVTYLSIIKMRLGLLDIVPRKKGITKIEQLVERYPSGPNTIPITLYSTIWKQNASIDYAIIVLEGMYDIELSLGDLMAYNKDALIAEISKIFWEQRGLGESNEQIVKAVEELELYLKELRPSDDELNAMYSWASSTLTSV